jgi:hypothetical protein
MMLVGFSELTNYGTINWAEFIQIMVFVGKLASYITVMLM